MNDSHEMTAWKLKHGLLKTETTVHESIQLMVMEDRTHKGKSWCVWCGEEFKISEMRWITPEEDAYVQMEDENQHAFKNRVRACIPCFEEHYPKED